MNKEVYTCKLNDVEDIESQIKKYHSIKGNKKKLPFVLTIEKDVLFDEQKLTQFRRVLAKLIITSEIQSYDITIAMDTKYKNFTEYEWNKVTEFKKFLQEKGVNFGFEDYYNVWTTEQVESANTQIINTVNDANQKGFTPLEKLLYFYHKVTRREYEYEDKKSEHFSQSRSVYGVLNSNRIVCVGFSEWLKSMILESGEENIKVFSNDVSCYSKDGIKIGLHENLIIYIKDPKYNIDGYYYLDPTWDSARGNNELYFRYFMIPLDDIEKIVTCDVRESHYPGNVSFSSEDFKFTKEFLEEFFKTKPKILKYVMDEFTIERSERIEMAKDLHQIKQSRCDALRLLITKMMSGEIKYVTKIDWIDLTYDYNPNPQNMENTIYEILDRSEKNPIDIVKSDLDLFIPLYKNKIKFYKSNKKEHTKEYISAKEKLEKILDDFEVVKKKFEENPDFAKKFLSLSFHPYLFSADSAKTYIDKIENDEDILLITEDKIEELKSVLLENEKYVKNYAKQVANISIHRKDTVDDACEIVLQNKQLSKKIEAKVKRTSVPIDFMVILQAFESMHRKAYKKEFTGSKQVLRENLLTLEGRFSLDASNSLTSYYRDYSKTV